MIGLYTPTLIHSPTWSLHPLTGRPPSIVDWGAGFLGTTATWAGAYMRPPDPLLSVLFGSRWQVTASFSGGGESYSGAWDQAWRGVSIIDTAAETGGRFSLSLVPSPQWSRTLGVFFITLFMEATLYHKEEEESTGSAARVYTSLSGSATGVTLRIAGVDFPTFGGGDFSMSGLITVTPIEWELP